MTHKQPSASSSAKASASATPRHLDAFARRLIRRKARQLIGRAGFTQSDHADLEQELSLKLLKQLTAFDPAAAPWHAFVTTLIERHAASLLRHKQAEKRDHRRIASLHLPIETPDHGPVELAETVSRRGQDARLGRESRSDEERAQLAADVADVLLNLPEDLQDLAERLKHASVSQVARDLGLPRTTLLRRLEPLRRTFEDKGLRDDLAGLRQLTNGPGR
ncbi:MAG: sigma-70 family RNA polymerase sigma factor [Gemmataceae bacterium]|nr:sigma-70 family RNA polymerase sigma factor [Gemmataceae bacterium]